VALEEKSISKSAELYFNNSEQLETRFSNFNYYSIHKKNREKLMSSGLIMLQKMPIKDDIETEENEQIWENSLNFLSTLQKEEFLSVNLSSQDILFRLFNEVDVTTYDEIIIKDQCRCSQAKVEFAIKNLSKKELIDISDENGNIKVVCEFCKTERIFSSFN
jgi:molecular chaperone Hsp33